MSYPRGGKCPGGELSGGGIVRGGKCPGGEMSVHHVQVLDAKYWTMATQHEVDIQYGDNNTRQYVIYLLWTRRLLLVA